jgi:Cof subfamily protein (haloacid dehalogenase superfamily)
MPFKAVACDLDGTLLRSDGTLDERSRRALAAVEATGAVVVICTARPARWMRPLAEATGHRGVAICANGGVVWDLHTDAPLEEFPLEPETSSQIVAALRQGLPGGHWAVERTNGFGHEPSYEPKWPVPDDTVIEAVDVLVSQPSVKLLLRHGDLTADELLQRARGLVGHLAELSHSSSADSLLEIAAAGVNKASALTRVCAERGIAREEVIAFGDMPNDIPMLLWAGHGVAMGNAHPEVVSAADEVTGPNSDDGVGRVLERWWR